MAEGQVTPGEYAILKGLGVLDKKIDKTEKFPTYIARNDDQMENELRQKGRLRPEPKKGPWDELHEAFKFLYKIDEKGGIVDAIVGPDGQLPTLMDIYGKMDFRGVAWNYGLGYVNSFLSGWSDGGIEADAEVKGIVHDIKIKYPTSDVFDDGSMLEYYEKIRIPLDRMKKMVPIKDENGNNTGGWEYKTGSPISEFVYNDKGQLIAAGGNFGGNLPDNSNFYGINGRNGGIGIPVETGNIEYIIKMKNKQEVKKMSNKKTNGPTYMVLNGLENGGGISIPMKETEVASQRITEQLMKPSESDYHIRNVINSRDKQISYLKGQVTRYKNKLKKQKQ
ncbi:MAG: hypothetical protein V1818_03665 [Candidatus Aenigmatarchaeota archaeon]